MRTAGGSGGGGWAGWRVGTPRRPDSKKWRRGGDPKLQPARLQRLDELGVAAGHQLAQDLCRGTSMRGVHMRPSPGGGGRQQLSSAVWRCRHHELRLPVPKPATAASCTAAHAPGETSKSWSAVPSLGAIVIEGREAREEWERGDKVAHRAAGFCPSKVGSALRSQLPLAAMGRASLVIAQR